MRGRFGEDVTVRRGTSKSSRAHGPGRGFGCYSPGLGNLTGL